MRTIEKKYYLSFALVSVLFLLWGLANNMTDTLLAAFKKIMHMSDTQTSLIQFAFYGAYFCFALPAALFIRRYSFKTGIILGLALYAWGAMLFYPAAYVGSYAFYLIAIYIMAGGCSVLETTANPYILSMGTPETATRRLNIAQSLNPIGSITGILVSRTFILQDISLYSISGTYMGLGVVLLGILIAMLFANMPGGKDTGVGDTIAASMRRLWQNKRYRYGVVTQFFYLGAQIGVWSFTIRIVTQELGVDEASASNVYLASIVAFCLARFFFTWLMKYVRPSLLMLCAAAVAMVSSILVSRTHEPNLLVAALVMTSFCMSLMFPTIYGIALEGVDRDAKIGASGLIMSIVGGALITPIQGLVSDNFSVNTSYLIPLICFAVVFAYSLGVELSKKKAINHG